MKHQYERRFSQLITILALALASPAFAWGPDGHRIVAHIAEQRLSANAREELSALLPHGERISDNYIANWPDFIRHDRPETASWHYVDIPYDAESYDPSRDCTNGQCIIAQVDRLEKVLADPLANSFDRNEALRFVVHFLGDIHQPLHCISRDDDRGGNDVVVHYPGRPKDSNLHAVWDLELVRDNEGTNDPLSYAETLNARITPGQEKRWVKGTAADWAWESHTVAVRHAYEGVPPVKVQADAPRSRELPASSAVADAGRWPSSGAPAYEIPASYVTENRRIVDRQLMKAGVRLAAVLNSALN